MNWNAVLATLMVFIALYFGADFREDLTGWNLAWMLFVGVVAACNVGSAFS